VVTSPCQARAQACHRVATHRPPTLSTRPYAPTPFLRVRPHPDPSVGPKDPHHSDEYAHIQTRPSAPKTHHSYDDTHIQTRTSAQIQPLLTPRGVTHARHGQSRTRQLHLRWDVTWQQAIRAQGAATADPAACPHPAASRPGSVGSPSDPAAGQAEPHCPGGSFSSRWSAPWQGPSSPRP
jgi:hypothetical protein